MTEMLPVLGMLWIVAALSAYAQAVSGFGFALLAVPLMIPFVGPGHAVVIATALGLFLTAGSSYTLRAYVEWRPVMKVSAGAMAGIPLGLLVLLFLDAHWLTLLIGTVVILTTVLLAVQKTSQASNPRAVLAAGVFSGVLLSSTGMNGPPLVVIFQVLGFDPQRFRASLQASFVIQDFLAIMGFVFIGLMDPETLLLIVAAIPALVVGWWLGNKMFARTGQRTFRKIVLAMLLLSGVLAIIQSVIQLTGK